MTPQTLNESGRIDLARQQEIVALAARLQEADRENVTIRELESLAAEAGVDPAYVREAIQRLSQSAPPANAPASQPAPATSDRGAVIAGEVLLTVLGLAAAMNLARGYVGQPWLFLYLLLNGAAAFGLGFVTRRRELGVILGALYGLLFSLASHANSDKVYLVSCLVSGLLGFGGAAADEWLRKPRENPTRTGTGRGGWFYAAWGLGFIAYATAALSSAGVNQGTVSLLFLLALVISAAFGAASRNRLGAMIFGALLTFPVALRANESFPAFLIFGSLCALVGLAATTIATWRQGAASPASPGPVPFGDRLLKLEQFAQLRNELEAQRVPRTFLSVDVVRSREVKAGMGELEAERLFGRYHGWLSEIVKEHGGEIQAIAGDGAMATFRSSAAGMRAARQVLASLSGFNAANGASLQLRLGASEGLVPEGPIGAIHSPVPDRAASVQRITPPNTLGIGEELLIEAASNFGEAHLLPSETSRAFSCRLPGLL